MNDQQRQVGDWLAERYEIFDIRYGGMGEIYIVYDHKAQKGRSVLAIKALKDEYAEEPKYVDRYINECRTWIKLDRHPHVVHAESVQVLDGRPMVIMELVTGGNLRHWIGTPGLDAPRALRFAVQFCLGMEHALAKGLHCHRDIKPENLLVTEGGSLKITDFGLAKIHDNAAGQGSGGDAIPLSEPTVRQKIRYSGQDADPLSGSRISNLTEAGVNRSHATPIPLGSGVSMLMFEPDGGSREFEPPAPSGHEIELPPESAEWNIDANPGFTRPRAALGTGPYMAPEQFLDAKNVDFRADLYAFGVVLYEMISGERPFKGHKLKTLGKQHLTSAPPALAPLVPRKYAKFAREIDRIVMKCLEKKPEDRYPTFAALRKELAELLWEVAAKRVPTPKESELDAWDLTSKGVSLGTIKRFAEERSCYHEAIASSSRYAPAWFNLAACLGDLGQLEKAIMAANVALRINPKSVPALVNKALALCVLGRASEARSPADQAVRLEPMDPIAWYGRGLALLASGQFSASADSLEKALKLRPQFHDASIALKAARAKRGLSEIHWARRPEDTCDQ